MVMVPCRDDRATYDVSQYCKMCVGLDFSVPWPLGD